MGKKKKKIARWLAQQAALAAESTIKEEKVVKVEAPLAPEPQVEAPVVKKSPAEVWVDSSLDKPKSDAKVAPSTPRRKPARRRRSTKKGA